MTDSKSTFERRLEILFMLIQRKKTTIPELVDVYSISRNTAYNDVICLSRYAPIYTKSGNGGGIFLLDGYRNDLFIYLSLEEEKTLRDLMIYLNTKQKAIVENILNKFSMPKKVHNLSEQK